MLFVRWLLIGLVLFAPAARAEQAAAPAAAAPDAALLERLEQVLRVARQSGGQLWPGWNPAATPIAVFKGTEMTVLVGHPAPPAGFQRLAAPAVSAPVFVAKSTAGFLRANTAQPFAGALTSFFSYEDFMSRASPEGIALALHEMFHAQLSRVAPQKLGDILVVLWGRYPEFSARNRALLAIEAELLSRAIDAQNDDEVRRDAAEFMAIRNERRKDLEPDLARYESGEESNEGLARYIEWRVLGVLNTSEAASAAARRLEPLKKINALERDRERFHALGMAEAAVLDRLRPAWKKEFETTPAWLDELLAKAAPPAGIDAAGVMERMSFNRLLAEQQKAVAEREQQGEARLTVLASVPGDRLVIEPGALKSHPLLRGFNPNGSVMLTPNQVAHDFLLLDLGSGPAQRFRVEFRGVPALYNRSLDELWCILPTEAITKALEAYRAAPADAALVVQAPGFRGEFTGLQVSRSGRDVRIRPVPELLRKPVLKPPEFVKP